MPLEKVAEGLWVASSVETAPMTEDHFFRATGVFSKLVSRPESELETAESRGRAADRT